jgi:DNA primase
MRLAEELVGKLISYYKQKLHVRPHNTGWYRQGTCPHCGKDKKFGVNVSQDRTNCFSCGVHIKPLPLLMQLEGLETYNEAFKFISAFESAEYLETPTEFLKEKVGKLPEGYKLISLGQSNMGDRARRYMENRGFNVDKLMFKGVGYCTSGPYFGRIIVPFYEAGRLVYFNARQFMEISDDKFKNPSLEEFGIGKSLLMYNCDCLHLYNRVYLMESAMNCLTWGDDAFGIGGKIASNYQKTKILMSRAKEVVVVLDSDAYWEALQLGLELAHHKRVKIVKMPKKKDVNDLGRRSTREIIMSTPWQSYKELYKIYLSTNRPDHAHTQAFDSY